MTLRRWILISVLFSMVVGCGDFSSGDRVLVCKPSYDNGVIGPRRYEVVVFKYPSGPVERSTPKNFIKRLLGLPGEMIAIFFGRVYHRVPQPNDAPFYDDLNRDDAQGKKLDQVNFWKKEFLHFDDEKSRTSFQAGEFQILRKPPQTMLAMRRIVYDNDFQAKDLKGKLDRWSPRAKSGWKNDASTGFLYEGVKDGGVDWLRYQHLERPAGPPVPGVQPRLITDSLGYNNFKIANNFGNVRDNKPFNAYWVGDLMLECNVEVVEAKGEFWFELSKGIHRFRARWDLGTGQCTLFREGLDKKIEEIDTQPTSVKGPGNYLLRFANIDARLTVWVGRALPFGDGKDYDPPEVRSKNDPKDLDLDKRRGPTDNDLEPASVGSKNANIKISQLRLWRDTYYTTFKDADDRHVADYDVNNDDWADPNRWEPIRKSRFVTMYVQPGHYLCLGDNSQASSDSRDWGVVPERLMLGRALVVYFPLDRIGPIR